MRRKKRLFPRVLLVLLVLFTGLAAAWLGLIPQRFSPFAPISLEQPPGWFLDAKLATLRRDPALCHSVLKIPHIDATAVPDSPLKNGCGWTNAVRFTATGGAKIGVNPLTCEMAVAMTLWMEHEVQPLAQATFGQKVVSLGDMGTFGCRNIIGNPLMKGMRSQHATANAIDVSGFKLADGRQISVLRDWNKNGPEAQFLREVHRRACRYFRVSLGPEFNAAHKDHFHFDRGLFSRCK
jgi:hypothetical protein